MSNQRGVEAYENESASAGDCHSRFVVESESPSVSFGYSQWVSLMNMCCLQSTSALVTIAIRFFKPII